MTSTNKTIIAVLVAFFIGNAITNKTPNYIPNVQNENDTFITAYTESFMEGCLYDPSFYSFCSCSLDTLVSNIGVERLIEESIYTYRTDLYTPYMDNQIDIASDACLDLI